MSASPSPSTPGTTPGAERPLPPWLAELPPLAYGSLADFLAGAVAWVERGLPRYLPEREPRAYLYDLAQDYPARGGKRFRPALLLLCAALAGGDPRRALPSAVALELFQSFALVHDDIEDGSLMRRGKPALHRQHGIPLAINVGDLLFGLVYEALLDNEALLGPEMTLRVQRLFAEVFRQTFEGQALDIGWVQHDRLPDRAEFEGMIRRKTGWYSGRGPCQLGALIGGAPPALVEALGTYGEALGIGFQLRDDLLNLTADSAGEAPGVLSGGYGKERGGDFAEGKRTLIVIELLERLREPERSRLVEILVRPPDETAPEDIAWAIERAEASGALAAVRDYCAELGARARAALAGLPASPQRALLEALTDWLVLERAA
ncbi:MAG TPA: polyprenyl synthetase family protein [bacterium]|nr:polyprenyl synthetase family protein [bacterium]